MVVILAETRARPSTNKITNERMETSAFVHLCYIRGQFRRHPSQPRRRIREVSGRIEFTERLICRISNPEKSMFMHKKRRIWIYLLSGLLILLCGYLVYWLSVYQQYNKTFTVMAEAAVPKMGELNNQIFSELPPPPGVELTQQNNIELWSPLATRMYYVLFRAEYKIVQASPDDVVSYYQHLLKETGWQESQSDLTDTSPDDYYTYYRDSSKIILSIYYSQYLKKYTLEISSDFWSQEFSPPKPGEEIAPVWCDLHPYICTAPTTLIKN